MITGKILENFCELTLKKGVNLQKNQPLCIICPIDKKDIAVALTKKAYELGAKIVDVKWTEEEIDKLNYKNASEETLTNIPKWYVMSKNHLLKEGYCYVAIDADDPEAFKEIEQEKLSKCEVARSKSLKKFSNAVMTNKLRWCVVSVPTEKWAKKVFPSSSAPLEDLSQAIERTMRLDKEDPDKEWQHHIEMLEKRAHFLNEQNFEFLEYKSSNGTNLKVGLAKQHNWLSAKEKAKDGIDFIANMPTEEVFTCPHNKKTEGIVYSALPLSYNGQIIDNFSLTFKDGKVISFTAEKGYETLKYLLESDKGAKRLGEVALIGKNSPIAREHILFYNTLFDENASCHLALGKAYPTTVKTKLKTKNHLSRLGVNDSIIHVDFMIGSKDISIFGVKKSGEKIRLFDDGEWII